MLRSDCILALEKLISSELTEEQRGTITWWLNKALPHVDLRRKFSAEWGERSIPDIVDDALRLEAERAHEPVPPFITEEMLLDNVAYLQRRAKELGERNLYILIPLDLEYPHAYLPEMIWQTHVDATAEEIVAELHRRQAAAGGAPLPPRWLRGPGQAGSAGSGSALA